MYNILLACDLVYYNIWAINCAKSIQKFAPWVAIHIVIVNPTDFYEKLSNINYYEDHVEFANDQCKIAYYQAVRFLKCAEIFLNNELVMTIDCDTLCTKSFTENKFNAILSSVHVQRHQKNIRWMAGLVTFGNNNNFRKELREKLLELPLEQWSYGWDQSVLNELDIAYHYKKLYVGDWMSFGRGSGTFLTLKGGQKTASGYLKIYNDVLKTLQ